MRTNWTMHRDEQWAILGPNGSGKALLVQAILGRQRPITGEIHGHFYGSDGSAQDLQDAVGCISAQTQRELICRESTYYQSRWYSGIEEGKNIVAQYLSQEWVEDINPFEVGARRSSPANFVRQRRRLTEALGITDLLRRKVLHLSNGEQRKVLLVHTLLRAPQLLILDDPYAGLDIRSRSRLRKLLQALATAGLPMLFIAHRLDELPPFVTHLLVTRDHQIIAQGTKAEVLRKLPKDAFAGESVSGHQRTVRPAGPSLPRYKTLVRMREVNIGVGRRRILKNIHWTVSAGENWAILGPNGSGKTTLLNLIQGDHPQVYALDLCLFDQPLTTTQILWRLRQQIGFVSPELHQHYPLEWSCLEVVCSGFFGTLGLFQPCTRRQKSAAMDWLAEFGLAAMAHRTLGDLAVGHQRLVLIARAMVKHPPLLILDEPCQGLDGRHRHTILAAVDRVVAQTGTHLLFVTHHPREMPVCITHVLHLQAGVASARPRDWA